MKIWLPKWLREERKPTDTELEQADRRLFLRGLALTSAGLVVGVPTISVPKPFYPFGRVPSTKASRDVADLMRALESGSSNGHSTGSPLRIESIAWFVEGSVLVRSTVYAPIIVVA